MIDKEAMQMALDALVSSTGELHLRLASPTDMQLVKNHKAIQALRTALAQPEPEPMAWMVRENFADLGLWEERIIFTIVDEGRGIPLYTAPPQPKKEWVGLTDEEITECLQDVAQAQFIKREGTTPQRISRTIEAKLKEKNG